MNQIAYIALGSNLGNAPENVRRAILRLAEFSDQPIKASSLWQTTPVNCPPGSPLFINAVVALVPRPDETPESLLEKLKGLQSEFGRLPKKLLNEPRPLDLDMIAFRGETRETDSLRLPHPRAAQRAFVLQPLNEIAPDLILPGQTKRVAELLQQLDSDESLLRLQ